MDHNNWKPNHVTEANMVTSDRRGGLQQESRQRIVNKIMDTLKRHLPVSGQEGLHKLQKIAQRFEEKIFTAATSQSDYLRRISLKMLTMETKSHGTMANPPNQGVPSNQTPDPVTYNTVEAHESDTQYVTLLSPSPQNRHHHQMDNNNWRPNQGTEANMDASDWRGGVPQELRQGIVNKILDTLKRLLPVSGQEGFLELQKIAERFEEKVFTAATSQSDYLRKIALKMLNMETTSQGTMANSPNQGAHDPGLVILPHVHNPGQQHSIPMPNQSDRKSVV